MYGAEISSSEVRKTASFNLPVKQKRDKSYKIPPGKVVFTCFTSDFLLESADIWREDSIEEVSVSGESGAYAKVCNYE